MHMRNINTAIRSGTVQRRSGPRHAERRRQFTSQNGRHPTTTTTAAGSHEPMKQTTDAVSKLARASNQQFEEAQAIDNVPETAVLHKRQPTLATILDMLDKLPTREDLDKLVLQLATREDLNKFSTRQVKKLEELQAELRTKQLIRKELDKELDWRGQKNLLLLMAVLGLFVVLLF